MNQKIPTVKILGLPILSGSQQEARAYIARQIQNRRKLCIFTPNPEIIWHARKDESFHKRLRQADLLLPDGVGVVLAARLRGTPIKERITGIDTGEWLLQYAAEHALSVFLLGARRGVAQDAKQRLCKKLPNLLICGTHHGYFEKEKAGRQNQEVLKRIQAAKPDLLFVCFGSPAQEQWICDNLDALPFLRLAIGLGGVLDVWSGNCKRAPKIVQACRAEWIWRALREPRRLTRLFCLPAFLWTSIRHT